MCEQCIRYNVTTRTLVVGLVTLYCMNSKSEHVLSIGNGFDVPYVSALRGQRVAMFSGFLHFDFDNRSAPVGPF